MNNPMQQQQPQPSPLWFPELQDDYLLEQEASSHHGTSQRTWGQDSSASAAVWGSGRRGPHACSEMHHRGSAPAFFSSSSPYRGPDDDGQALDCDFARLSLTRAASRDVSVSSSSTGASDWSGGFSLASGATASGGPAPAGRRRPSRHAAHHNAMDSRDAARILQCLFHEDEVAAAAGQQGWDAHWCGRR